MKRRDRLQRKFNAEVMGSSPIAHPYGAYSSVGRARKTIVLIILIQFNLQFERSGDFDYNAIFRPLVRVQFRPYGRIAQLGEQKTKNNRFQFSRSICFCVLDAQDKLWVFLHGCGELVRVRQRSPKKYCEGVR